MPTNRTSAPKDYSTAIIGKEKTDNGSDTFEIQHSTFGRARPTFAWVQQTPLRGSAFLQNEASPQVVSEAKNHMFALPGQLFYSTQIPFCLQVLEDNWNARALTFGLN